MYRWDIINKLIVSREYKSYLEIGYYKGWSFDRIDCASKTAVDPNPCKDTFQESLPYGSLVEVEDNALIIKLTSDDYFKKFPVKVDIVFIDGLHEADQVYKDLVNAFNILNDGGVVVVHDCNPPKYEHTTTGIEGCWTGDTYKGYLRFLAKHPYAYKTLDTDWGVGVIEKEVVGFFASEPKNFEEFDKNRVSLLKLETI